MGGPTSCTPWPCSNTAVTTPEPAAIEIRFMRPAVSGIITDRNATRSSRKLRMTTVMIVWSSLSRSAPRGRCSRRSPADVGVMSWPFGRRRDRVVGQPVEVSIVALADGDVVGVTV